MRKQVQGIYGALGAFALLVSLAACAGEDPGDVNSFADKDAQANQMRYDCLLEKGFAVTRSASGGVSFKDPTGSQSAAYDQANRECDAKIMEAGLLRKITPEEIRSDYRVLSKLRDCLIEEGFPMTTWPTEEVYVETEGDFNALESSRPITAEEIEKACPKEWAAAGEL